MKRFVCICLLVAMLLPVFSGCSKQDKEISCADVIAAYEQAGYEVWHKEYPEKEYGYICCIEIEGEGDSHISFCFFEARAEAESYAKERKWNVVLWLYSAAMFHPTWLTTETYGNIEIEYDDQDLYKPFTTLVKQK